jgi:hypothetical protein
VYGRDELVNATRYYIAFTATVIPDAKAEIWEQLEAHPPDFLLIDDHPYSAFPELDGLAARRYVLVEHLFNWRLYALGSR